MLQNISNKRYFSNFQKNIITVFTNIKQPKTVFNIE